jgi:uncharacterized protein
MKITSREDLRRLYAQPGGRSVKKQLDRIDAHARRFIELAPFVVLASGNAQLALDASPRGGEPGFVKLVDDRTLWLPDAPGNNRLDTLENIIDTGRIGLLFLIPGVDESLRINGRAQLSTDEYALAAFATCRRPTKLVIEVVVGEVYLHCAKALMRSALWDPAARIERALLPTMGEMLRDQIGGDQPVETQAQMLARYAQDI